jgi:AraC family transcriptional regulator of adaptative response/methylated-DNA-[protein]-cysteine methyltransferase
MNEAACWRAIETRDSSCAGHFYYGVLTTGVFCRPGCSSRTPNRENVRFFATATEAEALGYRPCRRCHPEKAESEAAAKVAGIRQRIEAGEVKNLDEWAAEAGWSPAHFQKRFKSATGFSPAQYTRNVRLKRLKQALRKSSTVTEAMHEAGYSSTSRLHEQSLNGLGMGPGEYLRGGRGVRVNYAFTDSPAGRAAIAWTERGVCFAEFSRSEAESLARLRAEFPEAELQRASFENWDAAMAALAGPVDLRGTVFQRMVWSYLRTIPPGETRSYSQVAAALGHPGAARAVARACASNRIAVGIPCHRVIASDGSLAGYRWGVERKRQLLTQESAAAAAEDQA